MKTTCSFREISLIVEDFSLNLQEDFLIKFMESIVLTRTETRQAVTVRLRKDLSAYRTPSFYEGQKVLFGFWDNFACDIQFFPYHNEQEKEECTNLAEHLYISPIAVRLKLLATAEESKWSSTNFEYRNPVKLVFDYACRGAFEKEAEFK